MKNIKKLEMANKTVYEVEHTVCSRSNYCETGFVDIKKRMMFRLIREIPIEDLEKVFQITTEERLDGENINIKIKL